MAELHKGWVASPIRYALHLAFDPMMGLTDQELIEAAEDQFRDHCTMNRQKIVGSMSTTVHSSIMFDYPLTQVRVEAEVTYV